MMLDPLAEVHIGVFVPIRVRSSQFVMDVLSHRKRGQYQQEENQAQRKPASQPLR
ncbi:MAG TPA: hypothetical protein VKB33_10105 [Nitrospira sp.]|nr:hypothetical protein [Nitrospira sp.]